MTNLSRSNIYCRLFNWRTFAGSEMLCYGEKPIQSFLIGFAKTSCLREPYGLPNGNVVKDVTLHPFCHEYERFCSAVAHLIGCRAHLRCFDNGVKIQTRQRPSNAGQAAPAGKFAGPSSGRKSSLLLVRVCCLTSLCQKRLRSPLPSADLDLSREQSTALRSVPRRSRRRTRSSDLRK